MSWPDLGLRVANRTRGLPCCKAQRVLSTHMGNIYPNHKGNYYYRNHTLYHMGTLDPLGRARTSM